MNTTEMLRALADGEKIKRPTQAASFHTWLPFSASAYEASWAATMLSTRYPRKIN